MRKTCCVLSLGALLVLSLIHRVDAQPCDIPGACETIDEMIELIDYYNDIHSPTLGKIDSFTDFARDFDKLFQKLSTQDLACRYDPGSNVPSDVEALTGGILRNRNSYKTLGSSASVFPFSACTEVEGRPLRQPECDDLKLIEDNRGKLTTLAGVLGCARASPSPEPEGGPTACAEGEGPPSDGTKESIEQITDGLKEALKQADEELTLHPESEGLRDRIDQFEKLIGFWEQIQAASCVPGEVLQSLGQIARGDEDACNNLCHHTFNWMKEMGASSDNVRVPFMAACTHGCDTARH